MKRYDCTFVGDINPDIVMMAQQLPVLGRELMCDDFYITLGGSTGICAGVFGNLGAKAAFYGRLGDDFLGKFTVETIAGCGVDTSHIRVDHGCTTSVTVSCTLPTDRALMSYDGSHKRLAPEDVPLSLIDETRHIHVGSFFLQKDLMPMYLELFRQAHQRGVTTSLDAGWDPTENWDYGIRELLRYVDIFFPNESEAYAITKKDSPLAAARELAQYCRVAVVKCGRDGSVLVTEGKELSCPIYDAFKPLDFTGAGDSYNAGFLYAMLQGKDLAASMRYGSASAGLRISLNRREKPFATGEEVERVVSDYRA